MLRAYDVCTCCADPYVIAGMSLKSWKDVTEAEFRVFLQGIPGPLAPRDSAYLLPLLLGRLIGAKGFYDREPTWVFSRSGFGDALTRLTPRRRHAADVCAARIVGWRASADLPIPWYDEGDVAVALVGTGFEAGRIADVLSDLPPTPGAAWMLADLVTTMTAYGEGLSLGRAVDRGSRGLDRATKEAATVALDRVFRADSTLATLEAGAVGDDDHVAQVASGAHAAFERYVGMGPGRTR